MALVAPSALCLALQPLAALQCVVTGPPLKLPSLFRKEKREPHACFALLAHNGMNYFLKEYSFFSRDISFAFCSVVCLFHETTAWGE